jgi:hypothetical protein
MRRLVFCLAAVAVGTTLALAQPRAPYSPASLAAELRGLQSVLGDRSGPQARALPAAWEVETPERRYSISTEPLRKLLEAARADKSDSNIRQAKAWLGMLAQQLEGFDAAAPVSSAGARAKLSRILARREFAGAGPPSPLEQLRQRIAAWIQRLLARIFSVIAAHPTTSEFLFWVLAAACVGFLAVWLLRWWTRDRGIPPLARPDHTQAMPPTSEEWLAAAHRAAEAGDWREAIHNAYWAAICRLQQSGALPADHTHTPREYLRLVGAVEDKGETARAIGPLAALTSGLERFWYARRAARAEDFRESINHLEALGCQVN